MYFYIVSFITCVFTIKYYQHHAIIIFITNFVTNTQIVRLDMLQLK